MKADKNEDIIYIIYSTYANQPIKIQLTGSRWIKNFYDGAGRLYKTSYSTGEYWEYTRVAYKANGSALTKTSETSFDPWGIVLKDVGVVNSFQNKFEYQNKEKESTFNLRRISFGARTYNASIGSFDGVDELADEKKQVDKSPYAYNWNNPVKNIDPDGRFATPIIGGLIGAAIEYGTQVAANALKDGDLRKQPD